MLAAAGISYFVAPETNGRAAASRSAATIGAPVGALQALLALYGYGLEINGEFDLATEQVVAAFQRHFRPERVDGIADASTIATLHRLARAPWRRHPPRRPSGRPARPSGG